MLEFWDLLYNASLAVFLVMTLAYTISLLVRNSAVVDLFWGLGFMVIALSVQSDIGTNTNSAFYFIFLAILIWGARLSLHLASRFDTDKEDWRYAKMRRDWGQSFIWQSYFRIFLLQGLLMLVISLPLMTAAAGTEIADWLLILAGFIWLGGFAWEVIADWQLQQFVKTKKKGEFIQGGLWKYSRHPNYFGELTMWWAIWLAATPAGYWWVSLLGPLTITWLITKVSGVPLLEKRWQGNKKYQRYADKTNKLIPWIRKS